MATIRARDHGKAEVERETQGFRCPHFSFYFNLNKKNDPAKLSSSL